MSGEPRGITQDGARWTVREVETSHVPGAQADRCLLFESEGVLRRAWVYPANWWSLTDGDLLSVMKSRASAVGPRPQLADLDDPMAALVAQSNAVIANAHALIELASDVVRESAALRDERRVLLAHARQARDEMRAAVQDYARALRGAGVAPDQAVGLVISAMRHGLGDATAGTDADTALVLDAGQWCREAYAAA